MQVGNVGGAAESLATIQGSSANPSEQANRQVQQQQQAVLQETNSTPQAPVGNVGQNINTTA